jgi:DNA repair exonuclease SbcCD ATPase subunit
MWWLVVVLLFMILFSMVPKREGLDVPEDPSVRELLQTNERAIQEIKQRIEKLAPLGEQVTAMKGRIDQSNNKLDSISEMCVSCTKPK